MLCSHVGDPVHIPFIVIIRAHNNVIVSAVLRCASDPFVIHFFVNDFRWRNYLWQASIHVHSFLFFFYRSNEILCRVSVCVCIYTLNHYDDDNDRSLADSA